MKQNDQVKKPFFAKFLENQQGEVNATKQEQQGFIPWPPITAKGLDDHDHTLKYPSDGDETYI